MEFLLFGALAGGFLLLRRKNSLPPGTGLSQGGPAATNPATLSPAAGSNASGFPLSGVPLVGAAIAQAATAGGALDSAITRNAPGTAPSHYVATIGAGAIAAALVILPIINAILVALGVAALAFWPIAVFAAAVAAAYALTLGIQDLVRLQYGQAGARKDFLIQQSQVYQEALASIQTSQAAGTSSPAVVTQAMVERRLQPYTEGHMARTNWSAYQSWMMQKNIQVAGDFDTIVQWNGFPYAYANIKALSKPQFFPGTAVLTSNPDALWHYLYAVDRGYFVGDGDGQRSVTPDFPNPAQDVPLSKSSAWVRAHCPSDEIRVSQQDVAAPTISLVGGIALPTPTLGASSPAQPATTLPPIPSLSSLQIGFKS